MLETDFLVQSFPTNVTKCRLEANTCFFFLVLWLLLGLKRMLFHLPFRNSTPSSVKDDDNAQKRTRTGIQDGISAGFQLCWPSGKAESKVA